MTAAEAARRAGVAEQTVHDWKHAFLEGGREFAWPGCSQYRRLPRRRRLEAPCWESSPCASELVALRREAKKLRMERELLKRATAFWVKESGQ